MNVTITVHANELHVHATPECDLADVIARLIRIENKCDSLLTGQGDTARLLQTSFQEIGVHMDSQLRALLDQFNTATNGIAARIDKLAGQIVPGMTPADVEALKTEFAADVARLQVLAADPADPVPATTPDGTEVIVP